MANITISTPTTFTNGVSITAAQDLSTLSDYLSSLDQGIAVSIPTTATGTKLTAMGRYTPNDYVWRIRNGGNNTLSATLKNYGNSFSAQYDAIPGGTDTFVVTPVFGTYTLQHPGGNIVKSAGTHSFNNSYLLSPNDNYTIIGGMGNDTLSGAENADNLNGRGGDDSLTGESGDDTLIGESGDDTLIGNTGNDSLIGDSNNDSLIGGTGSDTLIGGGDNDTLTGGSNSDKFVFTNQGVDRVTDFSASANDVFAITSASYPGAPSPSDSITVGGASGAGANTYIMVDTLENIQGVTSSNTHFAYITDYNSRQLLYDNDGNWSTGNTVIANVTSLGGNPTANNFDFI